MVKSFHEQAVNHSRLCMGIDVQPTPLEIKAILTVVPVAVYLVKGPVGKNWLWAKALVAAQNRMRKLQN